MNADSEQMRVVYEGAVKLNPSDIEAVQYLAVWHLERLDITHSSLLVV